MYTYFPSQIKVTQTVVRTGSLHILSHLLKNPNMARYIEIQCVLTDVKAVFSLDPDESVKVVAATLLCSLLEAYLHMLISKDKFSFKLLDYKTDVLILGEKLKTYTAESSLLHSTCKGSKYTLDAVIANTEDLIRFHGVRILNLFDRYEKVLWLFDSTLTYSENSNRLEALETQKDSWVKSKFNILSQHDINS